MIHERIRSFNTRETYPEQDLDNDLCQAVVARGTWVFLRGQVAQDLDTRESLHSGDASAQTAKAHGKHPDATARVGQRAWAYLQDRRLSDRYSLSRCLSTRRWVSG